MDVAQHLLALRGQGDLLAEAASAAGLDVPIPTCPEWRMRDLVRHVGGVHRWAAAYVSGARMQVLSEDEEERVMATWPDDGGLVDWFREGHADLVQALEAAPPDLACWSFLPAPSPRAFWARRQAHETAIHRADAESPGATIAPFPPAFAVDGIDELLLGFLSRPGRGPVGRPGSSIHVHSTDVAGEWMMRFRRDGLEVAQGCDAADCSIQATASDLYLFLWNRMGSEDLDVRGDRSLLDSWRETARVRWS